MVRRLSTVLALFLIGFAMRTQSQTLTASHHQDRFIDGAVHPELIPDLRAYRLYFVALSVGKNASEEDLKRQRMHLNKIGLLDGDRDILAGVLADFKLKHDDLVSQYQKKVQEALARNMVADVASFRMQEDELVQSTRDTLRYRLSPEGLAKLHSFVMAEKRFMRLHGVNQ